MGELSVRIQVLGPSRAWHRGEELDLGPPGRRAVLGLLALAGGSVLTMRELVAVLWDDPPRSAVNVVQTHVKHLRRLLEPDRPARTGSVVLPHVCGGYALNRDVVDIDLVRVRRLVDDARRGGDMALTAELLGRVLRWWQGPPLADIPLLAQHPKVVALVAERTGLVARYGDAMIATGAAADALPAIVEAAAGQPLDEPAQARLVRAYHAVGQRALAFQVYHAARDRLVEELGVGPGPELRAAHAALLDERVPRPVSVVTERVSERVSTRLPTEPSGFTGRTTELSFLDHMLPLRHEPGGAVPIAVLSGPAGVGKTALAVRWAHRVRHRFPDGQLYANLRGNAHGPLEILARFLSALGTPADRLPADQETAAALYRTLTTARRTLVVLDDVTDANQVRPLLPPGPGSFVVVTGRGRLAGLVVTHGARQLTLDAATARPLSPASPSA